MPSPALLRARSGQEGSIRAPWLRQRNIDRYHHPAGVSSHSEESLQGIGLVEKFDLEHVSLVGGHPHYLTFRDIGKLFFGTIDALVKNQCAVAVATYFEPYVREIHFQIDTTSRTTAANRPAASRALAIRRVIGTSWDQ